MGGYDVTGVAIHELRPDGVRTVTQVARTEFRNFPGEPWWTMPEAGAEARFVSRPLCSDEVFGIEYFSVLLRQR